MGKLKPFQNYFTIFYLFGLNSVIRVDNPCEKRSITVLYLPRIINICISSIIAYRFLEEEFDRFSLAKPKFNLILLFCSNYLAVFENMYQSHFSYAILKFLNHTIDHLSVSFRIEYPFKRFKREYHRKALLMLLIAIGGFVLKYFIHSDIGVTNFNSFLMAVSIIFRNIQMFHVTFYIDFIRYSLASLNEKISNWKCKKMYVKRSTITRTSELFILQQVRAIHMNLWHVSSCVNSLSGWFLVDHLVGMMVTISDAAYWVFLYATRTDGDLIEMMRK